MKTSTKLLISLFLSFVTAMFVAAISLRHQYDSFDKNDPYARWHGQAMPSFRAVQINGPSSALVQIEPGKTTRILTDTLNEWRKTAYTARVKHDTLFVQLKPTKGKLQRDAMTDDWRNPELIIQMPALMAVTTTNANCRIAAFTGDALTLQQLGKEGNLSLIQATVQATNRLIIRQ